MQLRHTLTLCASAIALTAALGAAGSASAQAATPATTKAGSGQVEEVIVTGSRIRGVAPVGSPLIAVNREEIQQSNAVTTTQLIQEVPQIFNLGVSETSRGQSGGSGNITYGTTINIRGIGPFATLIILDGHRAVPQGTSGFAIDPSVIPTIALERVDVVADGASAIYGSDAVAGVVNLILRRHVEGGEVNVRYGVGDKYDEHQIGAIWGHGWGTGQFTLAFENGYHSALSGRDRDFFVADLRPFGGSDFRPTLCNPGNIVVGGVSYAIPTGGVTNANRGALLPGTVNKCDNQKIADLVPEQDHNAFSFTFNQDLTDRISIFADGFATRREFTNRGGAASSSLAVPSSNAFFVAPPGLTPASETVQYSFIDAYPQGFTDGYSQAVNFTVGGDMKLGHDWKVGADYTWGRDGDLSLSHYVANAPALTAALASSNPATAFNPFGGANSAAVVDGILIGYTENKGRSIFQGYEAKADGPLFHLPGGEVRAAFGYEGQRLMVTQTNIMGTIAAHTGPARKFTRGVNSYYAEVLVPLVGPDNAIPGIRSLDVDLAGRYDNYSDVGETTNPKVGVNWSPVEGLLVHGSWGTSFRAPTLSQIYGNTNTLFVQNYSDPTCACIRQGVTRSGGNLNLKPEEATTWSAGADWTPTFLPNAKLSLTYFDIEYENQVSNFLADLTILNREAQFAGTGIITRNPSAALIAQQVAETGFTGVLPNPATLFVEGRSSNLGVTIAKGFDFEGVYRLPTESWGDFQFTASGTYYTEYKTAITPSAPLIDNNNVIFNPLRQKARVGVRWTKGPVQANVFANWLNAYVNNLTTPAQKVEDYTSIDLHLEYNLGDKIPTTWVHDIRLGLDVRNLFDRDPPFVNIAQSPNGGGGWDPTLTSPVGRVIAVSIGTRF
jgi:iron complex outermembrane receptor protein